jgi:hypothetical protein
MVIWGLGNYMPVNFVDLQSQVRELGERTRLREKTLQELRDKANELFHRYSSEIGYLRNQVAKAAGNSKRLRCAVPVNEELTQRFPSPLSHTSAVLLAADGSQINPDHHAAYEFALINVGVFRMDTAGEEKPFEITETRLMSGNEVDLPQGLLTEDHVAVLRDVSERRLLGKLASQESKPVVALTDGTLELFVEDSGSEIYLEYIAELEHLADSQVITAGYVDKPRADLMVRLLEFTLLSDDEIRNGRLIRPLHGVRDRDLFETHLQPGERSAVFYNHSSTYSRFTGHVALHFFYLNVGRQGSPWLARVEIPAWVAENSLALELLHTLLLEQCSQMGGKPYPYALHRAHEIAVISQEEKRHIENLITVEFLGHGLAVGKLSNKQFAKDISGVKTRYK